MGRDKGAARPPEFSVGNREFEVVSEQTAGRAAHRGGQPRRAMRMERRIAVEFRRTGC
jgi:hypothetical protein